MSQRLELRGQQGYILASVIAMLGLVAIIGAALMGMTITAMKVNQSFRDSLDNVSASDSALDLVVNDLRRNPAAVNQGCYGAGIPGYPNTYKETIRLPDPEGGTPEEIEVIVDCASTGPYTPQRDIELTAYPDGGSTAQARAHIVISDEGGGESRPGFSLEICDWQLGGNVRAALAPC